MLVELEPLPEAVIGCGQGYAISAWFQSDHPSKRISQTKMHRFLCGSAYKQDILGHLPVIDWNAVSLKFNW
jgi:hypothetical protein